MSTTSHLSAAGVWAWWRRAVTELDVPLYVDPQHTGLVRFGHASGGDPPSSFTVVHWPRHRPAMLEVETRLRSRRVASTLFDEVGTRCDPLARARRREAHVRVDGKDLTAPMARLDGRFVIAVELDEWDLVVRGRARDPQPLDLPRADPDDLF
jgi:hypothetical protein